MDNWTTGMRTAETNARPICMLFYCAGMCFVLLLSFRKQRWSVKRLSTYFRFYCRQELRNSNCRQQSTGMPISTNINGDVIALCPRKYVCEGIPPESCSYLPTLTAIRKRKYANGETLWVLWNWPVSTCNMQDDNLFS